MPYSERILLFVMATWLLGCGGSPSSSPGTSTSPSSPNDPNVSRFYGLYNVNFRTVSDTGCGLTFDSSGTVKLSGDVDGSNLVIEVFERALRTYPGRMDTQGRFSATASGFTPGLQRHTYTGTIQGEVQGPTNSILGEEELVFDIGCPKHVVKLGFTGKP